MSDAIAINNYGTFFDKIINLYFTGYNPLSSTNNQQLSSAKSPQGGISIICNPKGYKPKISLSGTLIAKSLFTHIELRVQNYQVNFNAGQYKYVQITAGYSGQVSQPGASNQSSNAIIFGQITQAYVETPGPDGVTLFIVLLSSDEIFNSVFDFQCNVVSTDTGPPPSSTNYSTSMQSFSPPTYTVSAILNKLINQFNSTSGLNYSVQIPQILQNVKYYAPINESGTFNILLDKVICQLLSQVIPGLTYFIDSGVIKVYTTTGISSSQNYYKVNKVTNTPASLVGGQISFQAPWFPQLRPDDIIYIDPTFMELSFGAYSDSTYQVPGNIYQVIQIDFDFDTIESTNKMIVNALAYNGPLPNNGLAL